MFATLAVIATLAPFSLARADQLPARPDAWTTLPDGFRDELVTWGLEYPVNMAFLPDGRLLVVERVTGRLRLVRDGHVSPVDPVLTVPNVRAEGGEQGLLGVAVDPAWPARPYVYLMYTCSEGSFIRISRFTLGGDLSNVESGWLTGSRTGRYDVLVIPDYNEPHNGGTLRFGPDGMLYASVGDDLFHCDAQDPALWFGKILRLDVSRLPNGLGGPPPLDLITPPGNPFMGYTDARAHLVWAYGFRNPWSFHIDPVTGDLFIGDVGASEYEEIDWAREPGLNFGWAWYEGPQAYAETCTVPGSDFVFPIHSYDRRDFEFGAAVVSAGLYRRHGPDGFPPEYDGDYFFSDFGAGFIRRLERDGDEWRVAPMVPGQPGAVDWAIGYWHVSHFLEGPDGALWYLAYGEGASGQIGRIVYRGVTAVGEAAGDDIGLATRPLPTRGPLVVSFSLSQPSSVTLSLFDVHGRRVRIVEAGGLGPGRHDLRWDGRDQTGAPVMAGLYYLQLRAGARSWTRRIPVVR